MVSAMLAAIAVFYAVLLIQRMMAPPVPPGATQPAETTDAATSRPAPVGTSSGPARIEATPTTGVATGIAVFSSGADTTPVILGNASADSPFPMELKIEPRGAVVSTAHLRGHYQTVEKKEPYSLFEPLDTPDENGRLRTFRSFATTLQVVNPAIEVPLDEAVWALEPGEDHQVVFVTEVFTPDRQPLLRVRKIYTLRPQQPDSLTFDAHLSVKFENVSGQPLQVVVTQQGPIGFASEELRGGDRKVIGAVWRDGVVSSQLHLRRDVVKRKRIDLGKDTKDGSRVAWVAEGNKYFGCIMAPAGRGASPGESRFARVEGFVFSPQIQDDSANQREDLAFRYITEPIDVAAGASDELSFDLYLGPKSKHIFESIDAYAERSYYQVLSGEYSSCTPGWLVGLMMVLLNGVYRIYPNYGIAIIVLVLMVKASLHWLSVRGQVNMQKMQKSQARLKPKMDAIKERYPNDRAKQQQAMAELMKEEGISPAGQMLSCLPMMLQIPIWIALWTAFNYTVEMRHAPFDGWWIKDLTKPDELVKLFAEPIHVPIISYLTSGPLQYLNLLPILLAITQVLQTHFMPRSTTAAQPGGNPSQFEQQRKMMMIMSVVFMFILYNAPSGLTLYIMASNIFGIIEQWRIRKHIAELEARGEDAASEPGMLKRFAGRLTGGGGEEKPKSWFHSKWQDLQKEVEDAKRVQSQRKKGRKG